ncbi:transposase [Streptomyces sp. 4503]|uniref:Transposase n=1 Tax=Streptomyces niphimycinicus TaxID=2842201 RepID=A0ABS6CJ19_9ACTN|nr:transposase [Streptomyces niphimycinicus]MBU3866931.1 transposase [Streptomyces niphimycinicus]
MCRRHADALFAVTDAVLCSDGPVTSLADEHRCVWAMYGMVNHGWLEPHRLRQLLAAMPLPRAAVGRIVFAGDVSNLLRPDAPTSPELLPYGWAEVLISSFPGRCCSRRRAGDEAHVLEGRAGRDPARPVRRRHRSDRRRDAAVPLTSRCLASRVEDAVVSV